MSYWLIIVVYCWLMSINSSILCIGSPERWTKKWRAVCLCLCMCTSLHLFCFISFPCLCKPFWGFSVSLLFQPMKLGIRPFTWCPESLAWRWPPSHQCSSLIKLACFSEVGREMSSHHYNKATFLTWIFSIPALLLLDLLAHWQHQQR